MSRNLILCCDGTSNQFGPENTNVVRLAQVLERDRQLLYYAAKIGELEKQPNVSESRKKEFTKLRAESERWKNTRHSFSLFGQSRTLPFGGRILQTPFVIYLRRPIMRNFMVRLTATALVLALLTPGPAVGWHKEGHMLVARVAWRQLSDEETAYFTKILKAHPHYDVYLAAARPKDVPEPEWVFVRAATWSDWVRDPAGEGLTKDETSQIKKKYNKPDWHFVNLPYVHPADTDKFNAAMIRQEILEPELDDKGEPRHALAALNLCMKQLKSANASDADKAVTLCWLLHLVGDLHQPLHCTALIASKDTFDPSFDPPHGDEGGNRLAIKVKATDPSAMNLHFYWDALLFSDEPPFEKVDAVATSLLTKFKRDQLPELAKMDFPAWAEESLDMAKTVVYKGDDGFLKAFALPTHKKVDLNGLDAPVLPDGYQQAAETVAARRMVLAGYRLSDQLKLVMQAGK